MKKIYQSITLKIYNKNLIINLIKIDNNINIINHLFMISNIKKNSKEENLSVKEIGLLKPDKI